jgi:hypothetical protein
LVPWIRHAHTLQALAGVNTVFRQTVLGLPQHHALTLHGASRVLESTPLPIGRALRILTTRRCELCGAKTKTPAAMRAPFRVYAHKECLLAQLCPEDACGSAAQLVAAGAPVWTSRRLVWRSAAPCVGRPPVVWTAEGAAAVTVEEARVAGAAEDAARMALYEHVAVATGWDDACTHVEKERTREVRAAATRKRVQALEAALVAAGLPLPGHGEEFQLHMNVPEWYEVRARAPYSLEMAVGRVRRHTIGLTCLKWGMDHTLLWLVDQLDTDVTVPHRIVAEQVFRAFEWYTLVARRK